MSKTAFIDGNKSLGIPGTQVTAAFLNALQSHRHDGLDQDGSAPKLYAAATGSANALAVAFSPALAAHCAGMPVNVLVSANNTGACTIAVNGLDPVAITKRGADPLVAGDIKAGQMICRVYDGTRYQLIGINQGQSFTIGDTDLVTLDLLLRNLTNNQWYTWDISSYLPAGAVYAVVDVEWISTAALGHKLYGRTNGSSAAGIVLFSSQIPVWPFTTSNQVIVPLGTNLKFDYKFTDLGTGSSEGCEVKFRLQGWLK